MHIIENAQGIESYAPPTHGDKNTSRYREAHIMTREDSNSRTSVSPQPDDQRRRGGIAKLYEDRPHPHSQILTRRGRDPHTYPSPRPSNERSTLRRPQRDISPWSSPSVDSDYDVDDDENDEEEDALSMASHNHQEASVIRASLLAESPSDNRGIRLLQEWVHDYSAVVRNMSMLIDSRMQLDPGVERSAGNRSNENDRVQEVTTEAARVALGPWSMTGRIDVRDGITPPGYGKRFRQSVVGTRGEDKRMYSPGAYEERRRLPEHSRGSGDDSLTASRIVQYGESREPDR